MIITKPKSPVYLGITSASEAKIYSEIPVKGAIFEFESLSNIEALKLSTLLGLLSSEQTPEQKPQENFLKYFQTLIKKIHNIPDEFGAGNFGLDTYIPLALCLFGISIVSDNDSFFSV